jgi:hypothetical protein
MSIVNAYTVAGIMWLAPLTVPRPVPAIEELGEVETTGAVESKEVRENIVAVRTEPYGALTKLKVIPRSMIFVNGTPTALHHLFINDKVVRMSYTPRTLEVKEIHIRRPVSK